MNTARYFQVFVIAVCCCLAFGCGSKDKPEAVETPSKMGSKHLGAYISEPVNKVTYVLSLNEDGAAIFTEQTETEAKVSRGGWDVAADEVITVNVKQEGAEDAEQRILKFKHEGDDMVATGEADDFHKSAVHLKRSPNS